MHLRPSALFLAAGLGTSSAAAQLPIASTFDFNVDGWSQTGAAAFQHQPTGGNPGGLLYIDNSEGPITYIYATAKFEGNLGAYIGGTLSFDGKMLGTGGSPWSDPENYGKVRIAGSAGSVAVDLEPALPPTASWAHYSIALSGPAWGTTPTIFANVLANVTELRISVEALFGAEIQGIDNVRIDPALPTAACTLRNGNGINPIEYACVAPPVLGGTWQASIALKPGTLATIAALASTPSTGPANPFGSGELLIGLAPFPVLLIGAGNHALGVPNDSSIAGALLPTQGFRLTNTLSVEALNALDLLLGL